MADTSSGTLDLQKEWATAKALCGTFKNWSLPHKSSRPGFTRLETIKKTIIKAGGETTDNPEKLCFTLFGRTFDVEFAREAIHHKEGNMIGICHGSGTTLGSAGAHALPKVKERLQNVRQRHLESLGL